MKKNDLAAGFVVLVSLRCNERDAVQIYFRTEVLVSLCCNDLAVQYFKLRKCFSFFALQRSQ